MEKAFQELCKTITDGPVMRDEVNQILDGKIS